VREALCPGVHVVGAIDLAGAGILRVSAELFLVSDVPLHRLEDQAVHRAVLGLCDPGQARAQLGGQANRGRVGHA
jgi:hypothetical protein